jgi:hypothetical protein
MIDPVFNEAIWVLMKYGLLAFLFLYIIFATVVIKQVSIMTQTVKMGFETFVKLLSIIHFIAAIAVFVLSFMLL